MSLTKTNFKLFILYYIDYAAIWFKCRYRYLMSNRSVDLLCLALSKQLASSLLTYSYIKQIMMVYYLILKYNCILNIVTQQLQLMKIICPLLMW